MKPNAAMEDRLEALGATLRTRPRVTDRVMDEVRALAASGATEELSLLSPGVLNSAQADATRPTFLARSLTTWRWIMRHPVSRATTAAIFVFVIVGVAMWFHGAGTTPVFADFLEPILNAKTVKYKKTTKWTSLSGEMRSLPAESQKLFLKKGLTDVVMMLDANRSRTESEWPSKTVSIWDGHQGKTLMLDPAEKRATVYNYANMPKDRKAKPNDAIWFRSMLLDARDKPGVKRESLGEADIDGQHVVGFRISVPGAVYSVWGDPKTGLPVRIEATVAIMPNMTLTMSDFEFNVAIDESLFSIEPPAGYEVTVVQDQPSDSSPAGEKDLIEMFRYYGQWSGGRLPDLLDMEWLNGVVRSAEWLACNLAQPPKPSAKRSEELQEAQAKLQRGMTFTVLLPKEADWHYAGKGVSLGAADTPVFWYRPKDAKKYRVIYGDLSVHEADAPPSVPAVNLEKDLIETFRLYSELSGGPLPDAVDTVSLLSIVMMMKASSFNSQEPPQKRTAKEEQEIADTLVTLHRGLIFTDLLPKEADAHYAGKRISLGAADTPIFWYRPKDSKTYRVIYADLAVRDAETPPSVTVAPPEDDLIDTFRLYSELSGGPFPPKLDMPSLLENVSVKLYMKFPPRVGEQVSANHMQELMKILSKFQPGLSFAASLPPEADAHYAGKRVSLGAADTPIFWYRPKDSKTYRVIYADLSIREADTPPSAPVVQPEEDLIDMLRHYSKLCGGPFPDSLDGKAISHVLEKTLGLEKGQDRSEKQMQEMMETLIKSQPGLMQEFLEVSMKLQPGLEFIASLPPEADAHYAGKGVSLVLADVPIFWYRPKDSKTYRVTYADLSVREADTPPSVPDAQPVPAPSSPKK